MGELRQGRWRRWTRTVVLALAALFPLALAAEPVDVAIVFAIDSSGSVDMGEFTLQRQGYAAALTDPEIVKAMTGGGRGAVAVTFFDWSGPAIQHEIVGWTRIGDAESAAAVAGILVSAPRTIFGGGTAVGAAIDHGRYLLETSGFEATRRVIDVSGDGPVNRGRPAGMARDEAVAAGITINGLPILEDEPGLEAYYRSEVIGGPGAFLIPAASFEDFARAVLEKLKRELRISGAEGDAAR
jgi:hypothetical protein